MDIDHIKRMYNEANNLINDSGILSHSLDQKSDAASFLKILGFEILLKCTLLINNQKPKKNHKYYKLWSGLPGNVQSKILQYAKSRMHDINDFSNLEKLLINYQFIFEKVRYFYEFYEGYTLDEQHELGKFWKDIGAPLDEADVRYYPDELECLIFGISEYIKEKAF